MLYCDPFHTRETGLGSVSVKQCDPWTKPVYGETVIHLGFISETRSSASGRSLMQVLPSATICPTTSAPWLIMSSSDKKLSYHRGTVRCIVSVEICQLPCNSAETTCMTSPEQIEVMKLKHYSKAMCNKHMHSTMTRSSHFRCPVGVINKPTTVELWITCIPTTCCGKIF